MSIDIDWTALTGGPDGQDLAESIRAFIHDRFQTIELPRMIRSVNVHTFNFGTIPPEIEIRDVLDPLPLFYQDSDDDDEDDDESHDEQHTTHFDHRLNDQHERSFDRRYLHHMPPPTPHRTRSSRRSTSLSGPPGSLRLDTRALESHAHTHSDRSHPRSAFPTLPVPTPGLGVNTMTSMSSMGYFHLPLSAGLSGTSTPLAAVAGGLAARAMSPVRADRSDDAMPFSQHYPSSTDLDAAAFSTEMGTETATPHPDPERDDTSTSSSSSSSPPHTTPQHPLDTQITARVRYKGDISLSLAAEILLDYPTPAFANIPMKLRVTGVEFNGDALVVYTHARKATHFCFLAANSSSSDLHSDGGGAGAGAGDEELLKNISIESEIGQVGSNGNSNSSSGVGGGGNQVLKNVDKIEKLILDQVRRIFRDEFVYPNYWTFLI